jgi:type II secretory pathway component PulJ
MIVAMAVLALISVLLVQGLRFGAKARERLEATTETTEAATLGLEFVRRQLSRAQLVTWQDPRTRTATLAFAGSRDAVRFVTAEPSYTPGPPLVLWELSLDGLGGKRRLMYRRAPLDPAAADFHALDQIEPQALITVQARLEFSYFGRPRAEAPPRWMDSWPDRKHLPNAIRLGEGDPDSGWPGLVVQPLIDTAAACAGGGAEAGGAC